MSIQIHSVEYYRHFYAEKYTPVKKAAIDHALKRLDAWNKEPDTPLKKACVQNLSNLLNALEAFI